MQNVEGSMSMANATKMLRSNAVIVEGSIVRLLLDVWYKDKPKKYRELKPLIKYHMLRPLKLLTQVEEKQTRTNEAAQNISRNLNESDTVPQRLGLRTLQPGKPAPPEKTCSHKCKVQEDTMLVNKKSFVAFICKVVNVAVQQGKEK